MSPVLEARLPEGTLTGSESNEAWREYFDRPNFYPKEMTFQLPDFILVETNNWKWSSLKTDTARIDETRYLYKIDIIDEIQSLRILPRNEFQIKLHIKSITRGRPSICDEIEL